MLRLDPRPALAAAVDVFREQGYEGARVQDIARAAGLTTGAIYANFRGKGDLLLDAIGARATPRWTRCWPRPAGREPREFLEMLGDRLLQPREQAPLLIDADRAARRDTELQGALLHAVDEERGRGRRVGERGNAGTIDPVARRRTFAASA